jgi:hypothetical protein
MEVVKGAAGQGISWICKMAEVRQKCLDDGFARKVWDPGGSMIILYWTFRVILGCGMYFITDAGYTLSRSISVINTTV